MDTPQRLTDEQLKRAAEKAVAARLMGSFWGDLVLSLINDILMARCPQIVVTVEGGMVTEVLCNERLGMALVLDWDGQKQDEEMFMEKLRWQHVASLGNTEFVAQEVQDCLQRCPVPDRSLEMLLDFAATLGVGGDQAEG